MITLYQNSKLFTFSDKDTGFAVPSWDDSIQEALGNFIRNAKVLKQGHSTFHEDHNYIILGTFNSLESTFMQDYPEFFI